MNLLLPIPDDVAEHLGEAGDVARRALEAFGIAEYQAERLTESQLRRMLGFDTRYELDGFLKQRGVHEPVTVEDIQRDLADLAAHQAKQGAAGEALAAEFRAFRRGRTLGGLDPRALIREGLR